MKVKKIILLAAAALLIALGIKGIAQIPGMNAVMEAAVFLEQPVVLPENEGKLVIVHGRPDAAAPVYDEELGLTLPTFKAVRYAEEYGLASKQEQTQAYKWLAKPSRNLTGEASLGGFMLDEKTTNAFPADAEFAAFDAAWLEQTGRTTDHGRTEQGARTDRLWLLIGGDRYYEPLEYSTSLDTPRAVREANEETARLRSGAKAYAYRLFALESDTEWTVAGIQQGSRLAADETLGPVVRRGIISKEKLLKSNGNAVLFGAIAFVLLGAVCVFLALRNTRKPEAEVYTYYDKEQAQK